LKDAATFTASLRDEVTEFADTLPRRRGGCRIRCRGVKKAGSA